MTRARRSLVLLMLLVAAEPVLAHDRQGQALGFLTGFLHPLSGLDHVLAMIAVGLWGAQLGAPAIWLLPVTFPMVMAFGGFIGLLGILLPGVGIGIALSALLLGLMVASESKPSLVIAAVLVGFFAIFHGHAHGIELPQARAGWPIASASSLRPGCFTLSALPLVSCTGGRRDGLRFVLPVPAWLWPARVPVGGRGVTRTVKSERVAMVAIGTLAGALLPRSASAHLVTTGLGPVYDGITHVLMSPDDLVPSSRSRCWQVSMDPRRGDPRSSA